MPNVKFTDFYNDPFSDLDLYKDKVKALASEVVSNQIGEEIGPALSDALNIQMSLPDAVNGEIHVSGAYYLTGIQNIGTNSIVLDGKTEFIGLNSSENYILYTGTGAAVTGTGHSFSSMFFSYVTPNGSAFDLTGGEGKFFSSVYNGFFNQASPSKITGFQDFASVKLARVVDGAGFEFDGTIGKVGIFDTPFEDITGTEIKLLSGFSGLLALNNNFFKDMGGNHIEVESTTNVRARITNNDFQDAESSYFVGFDETTVGFDVQNNTNQISSGTFLDAVFDGNTTAQTIGTTWTDIAVPYEIEYSQRFEWEAETNSFVHTGRTENLVLSFFDFNAEADNNNSDFEFAVFADMGSGFEQITRTLPFRFRQANDTKLISIKDRLELPSLAKIKVRVRKPSGSNDILFLNSKIAI